MRQSPIEINVQQPELPPLDGGSSEEAFDLEPEHHTREQLLRSSQSKSKRNVDSIMKVYNSADTTNRLKSPFLKFGTAG